MKGLGNQMEAVDVLTVLGIGVGRVIREIEACLLERA